MQLRLKYAFIILLVTAGMVSCVKPFTPSLVSTSASYLVVEGFINISDSTYVKLSRTVNVAAASGVKPELKAIITIESNTGGSYSLSEIGNGMYGGPNFKLSSANQYRLRIKTSNGKMYLSDFTIARVSPPIDTLAWQAKSDGVYISLNTHDPSNNSHYYRWDYTETYELHTFWTSWQMYSNGKLVNRTPSNMVWLCWQNQNNTSVVLNSTKTLSQDIVYQQPIMHIPIGSDKLSWRYSIILKQYVLTSDAYEYWDLLKKNTENLGSIFDAQPSASIGNLHNVSDATEPVIGYISAGTVASKRIFIDRATQLTFDYLKENLNYYTATCDSVTGSLPAFAKVPEVIVPLEGGVGAVPPICADCTVNGGSTTKPWFW